jgi:pantoate--beta-alanine ligase
MRVERTVMGVRAFVTAARRQGRSVGLVPTMGAFHEGHLALMRRSCQDNHLTVVSIFVNPTQFGPQEDFSAYPRTLEQDAVMAEQIGVSLIFVPEVGEMYAPDFSTWIEVERVSEGLCGACRPGHFRGVATVVNKLLNIVQPDHAYFGEKDYQQLQVIRRMVRDLDMPVEVISVPTVREADGLALSSRNQYLKREERRVAPRLHAALREGAQLAESGATGSEAAAAVRERLAREPGIEVQYVAAVDPDTLAEKTTEGRPLVLVAAIHIGQTRLIDNIRVD